MLLKEKRKPKGLFSSHIYNKKSYNDQAVRHKHISYRKLLSLSSINISSGLNDRVKEVLDADVIVHDLRLDCVNFGLLFLDLFLDLGQLILQGLDYFLSDALLFLKFGLA